MTLQELINKLNELPDKEREVLLVTDMNYEHSVAKVVDDGVNILISSLYITKD